MVCQRTEWCARRSHGWRAWVSFIPYRKMSTSPFCSWLGLHMGESAWSTAPPATTTPERVKGAHYKGSWFVPLSRGGS